MGILNRLFWLIQLPLFIVYMCIPFFWILGIPYWVLTNGNLMNDWCKYNGIK
jgi:hypothetical protein